MFFLPSGEPVARGEHSAADTKEASAHDREAGAVLDGRDQGDHDSASKLDAGHPKDSPSHLGNVLGAHLAHWRRTGCGSSNHPPNHEQIEHHAKGPSKEDQDQNCSQWPFCHDGGDTEKTASYCQSDAVPMELEHG